MMISGAWINGRTLSESLEKRCVQSRFGTIAKTDRIPLDINQDSYALGVKLTHGLPFVVDGDLLVTIHDFDLTSETARLVPEGPIHTAPNLRFTRKALDSAVSAFVEDTPANETLRISRLGRTLDLDDLRAVRQFSYDVCVTWGRGDRVWGNLKRHHSSNGTFARAVSDWLRGLAQARTPADALLPGTEIKGLGVSFASKHLRLFDPERFATLDEVIERGLGYARNAAGYNLWIHELQRLKAEHQLPYRMGDLESGLFTLVRQIVRGTTPEDDLLAD